MLIQKLPSLVAESVTYSVSQSVTYSVSQSVTYSVSQYVTYSVAGSCFLCKKCHPPLLSGEVVIYLSRTNS